MAVVKYATSPSAKVIAPIGWATDRRIRNTGTIDICLSDVAPLADDDGEILPAGSAIVWQAGTPLWTISNGAGALSVSEGTGALFDAGAVASQMIAQGLAGDIAAAMFAIGVPAANVVVGQSVTDASIAIGGSSAHNIDVGAALSYQLYLRWTPGTSAPADRTLWNVALVWYEDAARTKIRDITYNFLLQQGDAGNGGFIARGQCKTPYLTINHENNDGGTYTITNVKSDLTTFTREIEPMAWRNQNNGPLADATGLLTNAGGYADGGPIQVQGAFAASTTYSFFPNVNAGKALLSSHIVNTVTSGPFKVIIKEPGTVNYWLVQTYQTGSSIHETRGPDEIILPNRPVEVAVICSTTPISARISLTQEH